MGTHGRGRLRSFGSELVMARKPHTGRAHGATGVFSARRRARSRMRRRAPDRRRLRAVVGIGASAGGLEAFSAVLEKLPGDTRMAFVFVSHLDPKHESILTSLLARTTPM